MNVAQSSPRRRFRVLETLGKGGFGTVYRAEMSDAGGFSKQVALKVMTYNGDASEDIARRLRDEARILGLIRHRAVVGVNSLVPLSDGWGVVMEYINGIDLSTAIKKQRPPPGVSIEVIEEVAAALDAAYNRTHGEDNRPLRLIHRDIKPSNIRITRQGEVKLLDFGVATAEFDNKEAREDTNFVMGSARYMAPERRTGNESHRSDVYALGVVLANTLTGKRFAEPPLTDTDHARYLGTVLETVRKALEASDDPETRAVAHDVRMLLLEMLAFDPHDRPGAGAVEQRCRKIRMRLPAPWLRDWAEHAVPRLQSQTTGPDDGRDADTGLMLEELSGSREKTVPAPPTVSPWPRIRRWMLQGSALLAAAFFGFVVGRLW